MGPKAFSKAWREELIRTHSKARVIVYGKYPFDAMDRQVKRLLG